MVLYKSIVKDIIILVATSILFVTGVYANNRHITIGCITFLVALNIAFSLKNIKERFIFFIFQITFFLFLVGRLLFEFVFDIIIVDYWELNFSNDIFYQILISIFMSLIFLRLGYVIMETTNKKGKITPLDYETGYIKSIRKLSKTLMYLALLPQAALFIEKAILVQNLGYEAYYTDYTSNLPFIILKLGILYKYITFLFLSTMPSKKECKLPLIIFFIVGCLSLGYGQRNTFVLHIIFIFIYLLVRNQINSGGMVWFKRKYILPLIILFPFFIIFLLGIGYSRSGDKLPPGPLLSHVVRFISSQGNSPYLIGLTIKNENQFPENKFYSLAPFISFFKENIITKLFFVAPQYSQGQSLELALDGHSFSQVLSYIQYQELYLQGWGVGSCYIAELWIDFGYLGIALGNFLFGLLMAKFLPFCKRNVWVSTIAFSGVLMIVYAPRAEFLGFARIIFSFVNIITFLFIYLVAKLRRGHGYEKNPVYL
jgi:oligosaccharide repeat unit polymerase